MLWIVLPIFYISNVHLSIHGVIQYWSLFFPSFCFSFRKKTVIYFISFFFRYYAIVRPLEYPLYMTNRTVFFMLANVWLLPALISFTPIFLGWYTTTESLNYQAEHTDDCIFKANKTYAIISSSVSFWIPGLVMITMYCRIYRYWIF